MEERNMAEEQGKKRSALRNKRVQIAIVAFFIIAALGFIGVQMGWF